MLVGHQRSIATSVPSATSRQDLNSSQTAGPSSANTTNPRGGGGEDDAVMMLEVSTREDGLLIQNSL